MANVSISLPSPQAIHASITLPFHLSLHAEARSHDDVWSGKSDASTRRKLQNRLNQRAHRKRLAEERASKIQVFEIIPPAQSVSEASNPVTVTQSRPAHQDTSLSASPASHRASPIALTTSWCRRLEPILIQQQGERIIQEDQVPGQTETYTVAFEKGYLRNLKPSDFHRLPGDDHLLSLMYYNVFRALVSNAHILGLDTILMHADDYPSPFITGTIDMSRVPANLQPTPLQSTVPHHPCFDIFPDPVVRDNAIRQTSFLPHGMLCMTLAGRHTWFENDQSRRHGLVIWGPPENAASWEVTQGFVRHWGWLVRGSHMLEASTNRWRWTRGEQPLFFA